MIKANELMIDNWASISARHTKDENEFLISSEDIRLIESNKLEVNPIPITEEWLDRCPQLKKINKKIYTYGIYTFEKTKGAWGIHVWIKTGQNNHIGIRTIFYVHDFQNWFKLNICYKLKII